MESKRRAVSPAVLKTSALIISLERSEGERTLPRHDKNIDSNKGISITLLISASILFTGYFSKKHCVM